MGNIHLLRLFDELFVKYPDIEKTSARVREGLKKFGQKMEKIVVVYTIPGDLITPNSEIVLSFLYSSPEAWLIDFEKELILCWERELNEFSFCGHLFESHDFGNMRSCKLPDVYSLDEWFNNNLEKMKV